MAAALLPFLPCLYNLFGEFRHRGALSTFDCAQFENLLKRPYPGNGGRHRACGHIFLRVSSRHYPPLKPHTICRHFRHLDYTLAAPA